MTTTEKLPFDATWTALSRAHIAFDDDAPGVVRVTGKDARRFVHRLSTQHVVERPASSACFNTFLDKKGRVRHVAHHVTLDDETVLLVAAPFAPPGEGARLSEWLSSFHFAEELAIVDESASMRATVLAGRALPAPWDALQGDDARVDGAAVGARTFDLRVDDGKPVPAIVIVAPRDARVLVDVARGDDDALECARIAGCVPRAGREATDAVNPLELGLTRAIHWDKGCYTGQEVLSRVENRGKQARALVGLVVAGEVAVGDLVVGDTVKVGDESLGVLTSVAPRATDALPRALAVLRTQEDVAALSLVVVHGGASHVARAVRAAH